MDGDLGVNSKRQFEGDDVESDGRRVRRAQWPDKISRAVLVPAKLVPVLVGKGGSLIRQLQDQSGANIQMGQKGDNNEADREITVTGQPNKVLCGQIMVLQRVHFEVNRNSEDYPDLVASTPVEYAVPADKIPLIIGKGGKDIKLIQKISGVNLQLPKLQGEERIGEVNCSITGTPVQAAIACVCIQHLLEGTRLPEHEAIEMLGNMGGNMNSMQFHDGMQTGKGTFLPRRTGIQGLHMGMDNMQNNMNNMGYMSQGISFGGMDQGHGMGQRHGAVRHGIDHGHRMEQNSRGGMGHGIGMHVGQSMGYQGSRGGMQPALDMNIRGPQVKHRLGGHFNKSSQGEEMAGLVLLVPAETASLKLIGRKGVIINEIISAAGCKVQLNKEEFQCVINNRQMTTPIGLKSVELTGSPAAQIMAVGLIMEKFADHECILKIPKPACAFIVGKAGSGIRELIGDSQVNMQVRDTDAGNGAICMTGNYMDVITRVYDRLVAGGFIASAPSFESA